MVVFIIIFVICDRLFHNLFWFLLWMVLFLPYICAVIEKTVKQGDMQKIRDIEKDLSYVRLQGQCSANMP